MTDPTIPLQAGVEAPDFTLASTSGENVTLSSFRGRSPVLLAFFPMAFTGVCTSELCAFSEDYGAFAQAGVTVLPLSIDATPSLKEFKAKYQMQVELLSDIKREATKAFGVLRPASYTSQRAYFLVDTAGVIRWAHVEEHPGMRRENAEILAAITAALA